MIFTARHYAHAVRIGERIKVLREQEGLRQSELARRMGVSRQVLNKVEHGTVDTTIVTLIRVAEALRVSVFDVLRYDDGTPLFDEEMFPPGVALLRDLLASQYATSGHYTDIVN